MYDDFVSTNPAQVSLLYYKDKIKKMNIGFARLGEEECECCDLQIKHVEEIHPNTKITRTVAMENVDEDVDELLEEMIDKIAAAKYSKRNRYEMKKTKTDVYDNCSDCNIFKQHIMKANASREAYTAEKMRDLKDDEKVLSADLQKVIMMPRMPGLKQCIFTKRLVTFNETFAPVGEGRGKAVGVLWHEAIMGRGADDIASTYIALLRSPRFRDTNEFVIWVDNCS